MALDMEEVLALDRADLLDLVVAEPDPAALEPFEVVEGRLLVDGCPRVPELAVAFEPGVPVRHRRQSRKPASRRSAGSSVGDPATRMPAASSAATLDAAVPDPPEMIAPAWPIRLPSGAVRPAMKATFGIVPRCSAAQAAAVSSAVPPISPMRTIASVSGSAAKSWRISRKLVPMIGSPPIPTQVDWPIPASLMAWTAS